MWYEIFKFELKYRVKRPETYVFFVFLFLFSIVGVDFIFQGVELGLMKKNAPLVIAKTMGALTGVFMILASMIMGVPVLRDFQYDMEALLFINPISKQDYLLGRFLGSFTVLLFVFSGLLFGMMVGSQMPWHKEEQMLAFDVIHYLQTFTVVVLPTLFFGACLFFVSGMLSKKLLVVYTQGIFLFVVFMLTKAITNEYLQGILDPFSLTTLTQVAKDWSAVERNVNNISLSGILLHSKLFWMGLGALILMFGYCKFSFSVLAKKAKRQLKPINEAKENSNTDYTIPRVTVQSGLKSQWIQLCELVKFHTLSLLKETSFWAIVICGIIIILINSVSLGTTYGVDSYPATHFIIAELQEMSMYFFIIILLFYSGELIWKERNNKIYVLNDATTISSIINLTSKLIALINIYVVIMISLIVTGVLFQAVSGYYKFELGVYFFGFFVEILPFLILYTIIAFFFQIISKNKFVGIIFTLIFFILNILTEAFGYNHSLYKYGGKTLGTYSDMNGYGHLLKPYLWTKMYWLLFGILLLIVSALIINRGTESSLCKRIKAFKNQLTKPIVYLGTSVLVLFILVGSYIFYNTNVLNEYWTRDQQENFRVNYEKTLKPLEYLPQPKIVDVNLKVELYPRTRSYEVKGEYILKNTTNTLIDEIHIQKLIASHVTLKDVTFEGDVEVDDEYAKFDYIIYKLSKPLEVNATVKMSFTQIYIPVGFEEGRPNTRMVNNGTFIDNTVLPTLGYNKKYELSNAGVREEYKLHPRPSKAKIDNNKELVNARSGGDSDGINLEVIVGTNINQTAIVSGKLQKKWKKNNRNYFHYKTINPIINFYSIVSGEYEIKKDLWKTDNTQVDLEIYHHKEHKYNIERMMLAMQESLSYYSSNFTPYQYEQLRIMEFPRYQQFAQSFPGAIPFSEALGFVLDINDKTDIDMAFYITAHEVAHQWFGMQIEAANVQGRNFVLETLSQYAAVMVFKKKYGKEKVIQFLELQQEEYKRKRKKVTKETTLSLVEEQDFVYYNKGAIAMYKLQKLIGEDKVNLALRRFIKDWNTKDGYLKKETKRYPTSKDVLKYFRDVTSKDSQQIIHDLFEKNNEIEISN
ncbi:MAG: M1 family aminopeptidase [Flavobacteriaceae bacterium]